MANINRTDDVSQQKDLIQQNLGAMATGATFPVHKAPRVQVITDAKFSAVGSSGSPTHTLVLQRFVVGAGLTTITISGALASQNMSTSGSQTFSLPAVGSSLLQLASGDILTVLSGGANSAVANALLDVVVQNVQDIKPWY